MMRLPWKEFKEGLNKQKIDYVHNNPVEAGLVYKAEDYVYSSATDYARQKGIVDEIMVFRNFDF